MNQIEQPGQSTGSENAAGFGSAEAQTSTQTQALGGPNPRNLRANNLAEVVSRSAARANLDVPWTDDVLGALGCRAPRPGLAFSGDPGSNGLIDGTAAPGPALGTGDFSIAFMLQARSYAYVTDQILFSSHATGNNRFQQRLSALGAFVLTVFDNTGATSSTTFRPDMPLLDDAPCLVVLALDRDGAGILYVNGLSDRDKSGSIVSAGISSWSAIDFGSGNSAGWQLGATFRGILFGFWILNRLMNAADALMLARDGAIGFADQYGSLSAVAYQSDWSAGLDGFAVGSGVTLAGNQDGVSDGVATRNNCLKIASDSTNGNHLATRSTSCLNGKRYRLTVTYYIPAANTTVKRLRAVFGNVVLGKSGVEFSTMGVWTTETLEIVGEVSGTIYLCLATASDPVFAGISGEAVYLASLKLSPIGAVLDLDLSNADPSLCLNVRENAAGADGTSTPFGVSQTRPTRQANLGKATIGGGAILKKLLSASAALDFAPISPGASADLTLSIPGALVGDPVSLGLPSTPPVGIIFQAFVSAPDTIAVRAANITASVIDPPSGVFRAAVFQF